MDKFKDFQFYFSVAKYIINTRQNLLSKTILKSTHNVCSYEEVLKIIRKSAPPLVFIWIYDNACFLIIDSACTVSPYMQVDSQKNSKINHKISLEFQVWAENAAMGIVREEKPIL